MKCTICGKPIEGEIDTITKIERTSDSTYFKLYAHLFCVYDEDLLQAGELELPGESFQRLEELDPRLALYFHGTGAKWTHEITGKVVYIAGDRKPKWAAERKGR